MKLAEPVLRTKIALPITRPEIVSRERLREKVQQGLGGPLTLVTAPAGFGKTTLIASCTATWQGAVAWLSLDKEDNQAGRFLLYLLAALQAAVPAVGANAACFLTNIQQARPDAVLTSLINDLATAGQPVVLVLDDYHLVDNAEIHAALSFLIEHQPASFHLIISTRSDPPLPLARLRARGQLVELRAADLRFTGQEAALFLNQVMGLRLAEADIAALEARTEGWVAGLQMAALSIRDRADPGSFIARFSGTNRYILDYLLEEVLARQPAEIQAFLLRTALLDRFSAPLCDALLAESPLSRASAEILRALERDNLFLIRLEEETSEAWFRYHHLFADLLRARLQQAQPDLPDRLHLRAAAWLEQNGWIGEAIHHLLAAQALDQAADRIEQYGPADWAEHGPLLIQQAEKLPRETLLRRPRLGLYLAWMRICQARVDLALPLLHDLTARREPGGPGGDLAWVRTITGCALAFLQPAGGPETACPLPESAALERIPAEDPILRDAAEVLYGMALARRGDLDGAVAVSLRCIELEAKLAGPAWGGTLPSPVPFLARIYLFQGRLRAAHAICREHLQPVWKGGARLINSPGSLETVLGEVLYEWNRLEEAEQALRAALQANEPWGNVMTDGFGVIGLARVLLARGDQAGAAQLFASLEARMRQKDRPREFDEDLLVLNARLRLAGGDLQSAGRWADEVCQSEDFRRRPGCYCLALAQIRLAQQRFGQLETLLQGAPPAEMATNHTRWEIERRLLLGLAAAGQKRAAPALDHLSAALALAEPEGYLRVFLNQGAPLQALLAAWLSACPGPGQGFAQAVLAAFAERNGAAAAPVQPLVEPLSPRELEVLGLMALGHTNQQIADRLVVARGTVKAQAVSIFRKLDVSNRTEAVARARQLGILA